MGCGWLGGVLSAAAFRDMALSYFACWLDEIALLEANLGEGEMLLAGISCEFHIFALTTCNLDMLQETCLISPNKCPVPLIFYCEAI